MPQHAAYGAERGARESGGVVSQRRAKARRGGQSAASATAAEVAVLAAAAAARREGREAMELAAVRETLPIASFREQVTSMVDQHQVSPTRDPLGVCRHIVTRPHLSPSLRRSACLVAGFREQGR